tara:strand:- start:2745 stop:4037 length:1293 start_codon:yes stop_codon:yes gene_type:complete
MGEHDASTPTQEVDYHRKFQSIHPVISEEEESAILQRTHERLKREHFSNSHRATFSMRFAVAAVALCVFIGGIGYRLWSPSGPSLQATGGWASLQPSMKQGVTKKKDFSLEAGKTGTIARKGLWSLRASGNTHFTMFPSPSKRKEQTFELKRGFVKLAVKPNSMKRFEVRHKDLRVVVRGTKFTVEKEVDWMRVEVQRGKVSVFVKGKEMFLSKRQGARFSLSDHRYERYSLPPEEEQSPEKRLRWLQLREPSVFYRFVMDLSQSQRYPLKKRAQWLDFFVAKVEGHTRWKLVALRALADMKLGGRSELALLNAARLCYRTFQNKHKASCASYFQQYVERYPSGKFFGFALYRLSVLRFSESRPRSQRALSLLQRCRKSCKVIPFMKRAGRLLARAVLEKGGSCQKAKKELLSTDKRGIRWLRKYGCSSP